MILSAPADYHERVKVQLYQRDQLLATRVVTYAATAPTHTTTATTATTTDSDSSPHRDDSPSPAPLQRQESLRNFNYPLFGTHVVWAVVVQGD